jgi:hypothetical protein
VYFAATEIQVYAVERHGWTKRFANAFE